MMGTALTRDSRKIGLRYNREKVEPVGSEEMKKRITLTKGKDRNASNECVRLSQKARNMAMAQSEVRRRW